MLKHNFTIIDGGLKLPPGIDNRRFISAYATDTRLMGVVGLYMCWEITKYGIPEKYHHFFYLESEESGLESCVSVYGDNIDELRAAEVSLIGGLGGKKIELTERECMCLLSEFADINRRLKLPLPDNHQEYAFLILPLDEFSKSERNAVMSKVCTELKNYYQLVHYFLMRVFGKDFTAAEYLTDDETKLSGSVDTRLFSDIGISTLYKNTIDIDFTAKQNVFMCESLIGTPNGYMLSVTEVTCSDADENNRNMKIIGFRRISLFNISPVETAMQIARNEYVTVYDLFIEPEQFEMYADYLLDSATVSEHENGTLYIIYHKHNDHVQRRVFMLNEDVAGIIYVGDSGQMLAAAYDTAAIAKLEAKILQSSLKGYVLPTAKYEFKESVIHDFIASDITDFNEFIEYIKDDRGE